MKIHEIHENLWDILLWEKKMSYILYSKNANASHICPPKRNKLFKQRDQKSTVLSNTYLLLWFYGEPPGAKCAYWPWDHFRFSPTYRLWHAFYTSKSMFSRKFWFSCSLLNQFISFWRTDMWGAYLFRAYNITMFFQKTNILYMFMDFTDFLWFSYVFIDFHRFT